MATEYFFPLIPDGATESLTTSATSQDLSLTSYLTEITGETAADVAKVPAAEREGHLKKVLYIAESAAGDSCALTLAKAESDSLDVITFTTVGDYALLMWVGTYWKIIETGNELGSGATPTIA